LIHFEHSGATPPGSNPVPRGPDAAGEGDGDPDAARVGILYENDAWLGDLFTELTRRAVPFAPVRMADAAVLLDRPPAFPLMINRVSPSSYLRGHGPAIPYARALLDLLGAHGRRVMNGGGSFLIETSKVAQLILLRRLGVAVPRTILFNSHHEIVNGARGFAYPAILKPNCGGSGAFVRRVDSHDDLVELLEREGPDLFGPDHLLLLQEQIVSGDGSVVRLEFIDGEFVYAMRVYPTNTFNLCPAETCERHVADPNEAARPRVEFEPYPDLAPDAVAQAREIVRAAHLDVGGVEFIESSDGTRWFFDINATSVYRDDICAAFGVEPLPKLVDFIVREFHKELAKRAVFGRTASASAPRSGLGAGQ